MTVEEASQSSDGAAHPSPRHVAAEAEATASALEGAPDFPRPDLARIRAAAGRLAAVEVPPDDLRAAVLLVGERASIDVGVPRWSRRGVRGLAKAAVGRALGKVTLWYGRQLARQVSSLGSAVVRLGTATVTRVERVEDALSVQRDDIEALRARVDRLEARPEGRAGTDSRDAR